MAVEIGIPTAQTCRVDRLERARDSRESIVYTMIPLDDYVNNVAGGDPACKACGVEAVPVDGDPVITNGKLCPMSRACEQSEIDLHPEWYALDSEPPVPPAVKCANRGTFRRCDGVVQSMDAYGRPFAVAHFVGECVIDVLNQASHSPVSGQVLGAHPAQSEAGFEVSTAGVAAQLQDVR